MNNIVEMKSKAVGVFNAGSAIGEVGLVVPDGGFSQGESDEIASLLKRIDHASAWARGDWYNLQEKHQGRRTDTSLVSKFDTSKDLCAKLGKSQCHVGEEAATCARFPDKRVRSHLTYSHFSTLRKLSEEYPEIEKDLDEWVRLAYIGDRYPGEFDDTKTYRCKPWTVSQMKRAILISVDDIRNVEAKPVVKAEKATLTKLEEILDASKLGVREKKRVVKEATAAIKGAFGELKEGYVAKVQEGTKEEARELERARKRHVEERTRFENSNATIEAFMTTEEFKLILSCLHPDREAPRERKAKAFGIFNRLKEQANIR